MNTCLQLDLSEWTQTSLCLSLREKLLVNRRRTSSEKQRLESMIDIHSHLVAKRIFRDTSSTEMDFLVDCDHCLNTSQKNIIDYSSCISTEDQSVLVNHIERVNANEILPTSFIFTCLSRVFINLCSWRYCRSACRRPRMTFSHSSIVSLSLSFHCKDKFHTESIEMLNDVFDRSFTVV